MISSTVGFLTAQARFSAALSFISSVIFSTLYLSAHLNIPGNTDTLFI
jgi:hypothetical protein